MKKAIMIIIFLIFLMPVILLAEERSGEIIREIMNRIDDKVTQLEKKTTLLNKKKEDLLKELDAKYKAFKTTDNKVIKESLKADILLINAKLNMQDIEQVDAILKTISQLVPDLERLKKELQAGMGLYTNKLEFEKNRKKMGIFLTKAALILDRLKETASPQIKRNIEILENNLIGIYKCWDTSANNSLISLDYIDEVKKDLNQAFAQLIVIRRLLEQERIQLKVDNLIAMAQLVLIRLGEGNLDRNFFLKTPAKIRENIEQRSKIMNEIRNQPSFFLPTKKNTTMIRTSQDENILNRIRTGNYDWR